MPESYALNYTSVALAAVVGFVALGLMFVANLVLSPRRRTEMKGMAYECGIPPAPFVWSQLHIRYYIFAILFLIFDVEAVFLFPWAVVFNNPAAIPEVFRGPVFYEMVIFLGVLLFGLAYGWRKGVLVWR
ncbi:MAG: NADH-quinone oxidoreductase subunit A [Chloroflexi bacterium]|nr:NADH-quinone oxidoreductase subunit A [Chloroflexota bacterium]